MAAWTNNTSTEPQLKYTYAMENVRSEEPRPLASSTTHFLDRQFGLNARIHKLLRDISQLKENWDYDNAMAPCIEVIKRAEHITGIFESHGQPIFNAAPGPNGEIMLDLRNATRQKSLEIIFYPSRSVSVLFNGNESPVQEVFEMANLPRLLSWLHAV